MRSFECYFQSTELIRSGLSVHSIVNVILSDMILIRFGISIRNSTIQRNEKLLRNRNNIYQENFI